MKKLCDCLKHPLVLLLISGLGIGLIQHKVLIKINREEKRLDRKYTILTKCSSLPAACYQEIWNLWYSVKNNEPRENRIRYRERLQSIFIEANSIGAELPVLFKNQNIAKDWHEFLRLYQVAQYPITRDSIEEKDLNEKLGRAKPHLARIIQNIYKEIGYDKQIPPISSNKVFALLALLCGFMAAWTALINNCKNELIKQLSDMIKKPEKERNYEKDIRPDYRFLAKKRYGIEEKNWTNVFDPTSDITKRLDYDKSTAMRSIFWFVLYSVSIAIGLFVMK